MVVYVRHFDHASRLLVIDVDGGEVLREAERRPEGAKDEGVGFFMTTEDGRTVGEYRTRQGAYFFADGKRWLLDDAGRWRTRLVDLEPRGSQARREFSFLWDDEPVVVVVYDRPKSLGWVYHTEDHEIDFYAWFHTVDRQRYLRRSQ
jgi:hypothetical protein